MNFDGLDLNLPGRPGQSGFTQGEYMGRGEYSTAKRDQTEDMRINDTSITGSNMQNLSGMYGMGAMKGQTGTLRQKRGVAKVVTLSDDMTIGKSIWRELRHSARIGCNNWVKALQRLQESIQEVSHEVVGE